MDRIIEIKVNGSYVEKDCRNAGVQGEYNVTAMRIAFDEGWDGFAKHLTFWDALGKNPVKRILTADLLEDITKSTRIYMVPIPGEPLAVAGECSFVIDGWAEGRRQRSVEDRLRVRPAGFAEEAAEPADPTPTQAEQLQASIEAIRNDMADASGLTVEAGKACDFNQFAPAEALNGRWRSLVVAKIVVPDGYDRIRLRSGRIPVDGSGTVRFFACTLADDGATGTLTVEALLGSAEAIDGAAALVTGGSYTTDHTVYIAAFADTDMLCGVDLTGIGTSVFPQIADDAGEPDSIGDEIPVSMVNRRLAVGDLAYDAVRDTKTLKEIQAENHDRLTALEARLAALEAATAAEA